MDKSRFVLAIIFSTAILFGWNLLFPVKPPPPQSNANANSNASSTEQKPSPTTAVSETPTSQNQQSTQGPIADVPSDNTTPRKIKVSTPLYDVMLDSRGAVATSWIIKKNKDTQRALYSVGGTKDNPQPLELIPQESVNQEQREAPLRLRTVDGEKTAEGRLVDSLLDTRNYEVKELKGENERTDLQGASFDIP
jgi:YidC/Oxa1 family membrane protein insertase